MEFDIEVRRGFVKRSVSRRRDNPVSNQPAFFNVYARRNWSKAYISGSEIPFTARAQSRCVLTDMRMDSVPPDVVAPAPVGLLYIRRHIATISASIFLIAGKTSGCNGLETQYR